MQCAFFLNSFFLLRWRRGGVSRDVKRLLGFLTAEKVYRITVLRLARKAWGKGANELVAVPEFPDTLWGIEYLSPRSENYILHPYFIPEVMHWRGYFAHCYSLVFDQIVWYYLVRFPEWLESHTVGWVGEPDYVLLPDRKRKPLTILRGVRAIKPISVQPPNLAPTVWTHFMFTASDKF